MDQLVKKFEQLHLNLANRIEVLAAQVERQSNKPIRRNDNRSQSKTSIICYKCNEPGHIARDCMSEKANLNSRNIPNNRKINYIETEETSEEEDVDEIYVGQRGRPPLNRPTPYTKDRKEKVKQSESQKEQQLRTKSTFTPQPMVVDQSEEEPIGSPRVVPKVKKPRMKSQPSVVDQLSPYDISDDILTMKSQATLGQMLQYPNQRRNLVKILKRPKKVAETNYLQSEEDK
jgi:hypothetical protein